MRSGSSYSMNSDGVVIVDDFSGTSSHRNSNSKRTFNSSLNKHMFVKQMPAHVRSHSSIQSIKNVHVLNDFSSDEENSNLNRENLAGTELSNPMAMS